MFDIKVQGFLDRLWNSKNNILVDIIGRIKIEELCIFQEMYIEGRVGVWHRRNQDSGGILLWNWKGNILVETRKGKNIEGCRFKELYIQGRSCICCIGNLICVLKLWSGIPKKNLNLVPCLEHRCEKFGDSMHQFPLCKIGTHTICGMLNPS